MRYVTVPTMCVGSFVEGVPRVLAACARAVYTSCSGCVCPLMCVSYPCVIGLMHETAPLLWHWFVVVAQSPGLHGALCTVFAASSRTSGSGRIRTIKACRHPERNKDHTRTSNTTPQGRVVVVRCVFVVVLLGV